MLLLLVGLQITLAPRAGLGAAAPFLPLLAVVSWSVLRGPGTGIRWALALGLALDQLAPSPVGVYTLPLVAASGAAALGRGVAFERSIVLPAAMTAFATAVFILVQLGLIAAIGGHVPWDPWSLGQTVAPRIALNLLWLPAVYLPVRWLARSASQPVLGYGLDAVGTVGTVGRGV